MINKGFRISVYPQKKVVVVDKMISTIEQHNACLVLRVPFNISIAQLSQIISRCANIENSASLYLFLNNHIMPSISELSSIHEHHAAADGVLCMSYNMDSTFGCDSSQLKRPANFRDVAAALRSLGCDAVGERKLLRGGSIDYMSCEELGNPKTIVSLRASQDSPVDGVKMIHVPTIGDTDRYMTGHKDVRAWLTNLFVALSQSDIESPVLLHCVSGKDRTGVAVCFILATVLGVPLSTCRDEALLSSDVKGSDFDKALEPLMLLDRQGKSRREYFRVKHDEIRWDRLEAWLRN